MLILIRLKHILFTIASIKYPSLCRAHFRYVINSTLTMPWTRIIQISCHLGIHFKSDILDFLLFLFFFDGLLFVALLSSILALQLFHLLVKCPLHHHVRVAGQFVDHSLN